MIFTAKQKLLNKSQEWEPIFMYTNPATNEVNFGIVRIKKTCLYITLSLRPLIKHGFIHKTGEEVTFDLPSYGLKGATGSVIKINLPK